MSFKNFLKNVFSEKTNVVVEANGPLTKLSISKEAAQAAKPVHIWGMSYEESVKAAAESAAGMRAFGANLARD